MKYLQIFFALFLLLAISQHSKSQNLHAFLFCKTTDPKIGKGAALDYTRVRDLCQQLSYVLGYEFVDRSLTGIAYNYNGINAMLNNSNKKYPDITSKDIVIIYYSTHGYKLKSDTTNQFPEIDVSNNMTMSTFDIHNRMLKAKPKFLISIIDACSEYKTLSKQQSFLLTPKSFTTESASGPINISKSRLESLFNNCGDIIITAVQPGFSAVATEGGSHFTISLLDAINESFSGNSDLNWNTILNQTKKFTIAKNADAVLLSSTYKSYPVWSPADCYRVISKSMDTTYIPPLATFTIDTYRRRKRSDWYTVELSVSSANPIDSVIYYLDSTMPDSIVKLKSDTNNEKFSYSFDVWGEYPIKTKVYYSHGGIDEIYGEIIFKD